MIFAAYGLSFKRVIEFGMGLYSTPFFLERECAVHSVEMQSEEWYKEVVDRYGDSNNLTPYLYVGPNKFLNEIGVEAGRYDFAFVDGHLLTRPECINACFEAGIPIVATHDFEDPQYGWERVRKPDNYHHVIYKVKPDRHSAFWVRGDYC
jgi:hypothetical protein